MESADRAAWNPPRETEETAVVQQINVLEEVFGTGKVLTTQDKSSSWGPIHFWYESTEAFQDPESQQRKDFDGLLNEDSLRSALKEISIDSPELDQAFSEVLLLLTRVKVLRLLLWHLYRLLYLQRLDHIKLAAEEWPNLPEDHQPEGDMFYALLVVLGVPHLFDLNRSRNIPRQYTVDTLDDIWRWIRHNKRVKGRYGLQAEHADWLLNHLSGALFRLGRLQFHQQRWHYGHRVFRHKKEQHRIQVLANPKITYDGEGLCFAESSTGKVIVGEVWRGKVEQRGAQCIEGNLIDGEMGIALKESCVSLVAEEWECILKDGDSCLLVHIPEGAPLYPSACKASFEQASKFFPTYFPDFLVHAYFTDTWLLDPLLGQCMPPGSNIVQFLREWFLLPLPHTSDEQTLERVFDIWDKHQLHSLQVSDLPQNTQLQRAVVALIRTQKRILKGLGVILPDDWRRWGEQQYRH